jgi:hypothetical protein
MSEPLLYSGLGTAYLGVLLLGGERPRYRITRRLGWALYVIGLILMMWGAA